MGATKDKSCFIDPAFEPPVFRVQQHDVDVLKTVEGRRYVPMLVKQLSHLSNGVRNMLGMFISRWELMLKRSREPTKMRDQLARIVGILPVIRLTAINILILIRQTMFGCCSTGHDGCIRLEQHEPPPNSLLPVGIKQLLRLCIKLVDRCDSLVSKNKLLELSEMCFHLAEEIARTFRTTNGVANFST